MVKMSANKKKALQSVFKFTKTTFLWGFIPFVVYLGKFFFAFTIVPRNTDYLKGTNFRGTNFRGWTS